MALGQDLPAAKIHHRQVKRLVLSGPDVRIPGLMSSIGGISSLTLYGEVGPDEIKCLSSHPHLVELRLARSSVDDASLAYLSSLAHLRRLDLSETNIGAHAVEHLKKLTSLDELNVEGKGLDEAACREIQEALPGCAIHD